jgi:MYXO-CTERM domain-containing protein
LPAPPVDGSGEEEGCACRAAGAPTRSSNHYLALVALGLALTGLRRRRRPQLSE